MNLADRADPIPEASHRWSPADDYLADPAVAPMRALLAAVVRRVKRTREKARRREQRPQPPSHRVPSPA